MIRSMAFLLVVVLICSAGFAQDEDYTLKLTGADGSSTLYAEIGDDIDVYVSCDYADGDDMQGYQWGVCHDGEYLGIEDRDVTNGADTEDISYTFEAVTVIDETDAQGWTVGALFNVITAQVLEPKDDCELYIATYELLDAEGSDIEFCETLGVPAVTVRVIVDSAEIEPIQENLIGGIIEGPPPLEWVYALGDEDGTLEEMTVSESFTVHVYVSDPGDSGLETQGFQMAIGFDTDVIEGVVPDDDEDLLEGILLDMDDGAGPAFFGPNFEPDGGGGITVGCVYDLFGDIVVTFGTEEEVVFHLDFEWIDTDVGATDLTFPEELGDPPLVNQVVVEGEGYLVESVGLTLEFDGVTDEKVSLAGDVDEDGDVDIEDVFDVIAYLYQDGAGICEAAAAGLDDPEDELQNADIIFLLNYLFIDGLAPDPQCQALDCVPSDAC